MSKRTRRPRPLLVAPRLPRRQAQGGERRAHAGSGRPPDRLPGAPGKGPDPVARDGRAAAAGVSLLLGVTAAMAVTGLVTRLAQVYSADTSGGGLVIGAALVALAVGVRVPQGLAPWRRGVVRRLFVACGRTSPTSDVRVAPDSGDRSLYWVVSALVTLAAGILTAMLPLNLRIAVLWYEQMRAQFIWPAIPLALLELLTSFAAVAVPFGAVGLAMSCAHRLSDRHGQWDTRATAWIMIGAAGGMLIARAVTRAMPHVDVTLAAAALPALAASLVVAAAGAEPTITASTAAGLESALLPTWTDRWPRLLRGGIVVVGGTGVWAMTVWSRHFGGWGCGARVIVPAMFAAMGVGVLAGCRRTSRDRRSIGGFGVACALSGAVTAGGSWGLTVAAWGGPGFAAALACASVAAIGFATAYGRQVLLHRVASRSVAGAKVLTRILVSGALIVWIGVPVAIRFLGLPGAVMMAALSLLVLGGVLIVHEPDYSRRTRRVRLGVVFGLIGAIIVVAARASDGFRWNGASVSISGGRSVVQARTITDAAPGVSDDR